MEIVTVKSRLSGSLNEAETGRKILAEGESVEGRLCGRISWPSRSRRHDAYFRELGTLILNSERLSAPRILILKRYAINCIKRI